jgi:class 3 adenylate cyclase/tetratricopeptide (TPR) repeat protein
VSQIASNVVLERYAPRVALQWLLDDPNARHCSVQGTLGFFDLSGFTRLSERLGRAGKIGVETVNEIVDRLYHGLIDPALNQGGDVLQFSGDAVLVLFRGAAHEARAAEAANQMQRFLARDGRVDTEVGAVRLRMSVGMHSGKFELALLGAEHRFLLAFGPEVSVVCNFEKLAEPGEVLCSPELGDGLPPSAIGAATRGGFLLKRRGRLAVDLVAPQLPDAPNYANSFLFPDLRGNLSAARGASGHRSVTAAFIGVRGVDALVQAHGARDVADRLYELSRVVEDAVAEFDVTWTTTDALVDGCHFMLTSQLLRTHEDENDRMLLLARRVIESGTGLRVAIGVNHGRVFVGEAGHPERRVFTAFGDAINSAARVMKHAADGVVLATPAVLDRTHIPFATERQRPFKAKGKAAPVEISAVGPPAGGRLPGRGGAGRAAPFVGREDALAVLRAGIAAARAGTGGVIDIVGEAGLGKTRLVAEAEREEHAAQASETWRVIAEPYARATPYGAFRPLVRQLIGAGSHDRAAASDALRRWVDERAPALKPWLPLLALVADAEAVATAEVDRLGPDYVRSRLHQTMSAFIETAAEDAAVVVVEDAHWLDDASLELLRHLAADAVADHLLWIVTRRPELDDLGIDGPIQTVALAPLTPTDIRALTIDVAGETALSTDALDGVVARAGGNPLFASELAMTAQFTDDLPESIEQVAAARIDALALADRTLLRDASVLGVVVALDMLGEVRVEPSPATDPRWRALADYLEPVNSNEFRFRHEVLRVAAYEGLPYRRRRELHERVGDLIEARHAQTELDELAPVLALHFHAAQRFDRSWAWSQRAGRNAVAKSAYTDAARHYRQALTAARRLGDISPQAMVVVAEALGDACERTSRLEEAYAAFNSIRKLTPDDHIAGARVAWKLGRVQMNQGKYPQSLRTITRGLRELDGQDGPTAQAERARLLEAYSATRYYQGRLRDAISYSEAAIAAAREAGDDAALAQAHLQLEMMYSDIGDQRCVQHGEDALKLFTALGDDLGLGTLLLNLGVSAATGTAWDDAVDYYAQSADAYDRAGHEVAAWCSRNNLSEVLTDQGHYDAANEILLEARRVFRAASYQWGIAITASGLSRIALRTHDLAGAGRLLDEAIALFAELGSRAYGLDAQVRRVEWLVFAGRPEEAIELADALAVDIAREEAQTGPVGALPVTLDRFRAWALLAQDRADEARACCESVRARAAANGFVFEEAMALHTAALVASLLGTDATALRAAADGHLKMLHVVAVPDLPIGTTTT